MKKVTVFIDLDGVCVDWLGAMRESAGLPESAYDGFRKNPASLIPGVLDAIYGGRPAFEKMMQSRPASFWSDLKSFAWEKSLIAKMRLHFPIAFLTSPGVSPASAEGKLNWRNRNYPDIPIIITRDKYLAASPTKVLIDDDLGQLARFERAGGRAIQWSCQFALEKENPTEVEEIINETVVAIQMYESLL